MVHMLGVVALTWSLQAAPADERPQSPLASVNVALWPEYDRPAMLVILRASLAPSVPLPAVAVLPVPVTVVTPHAVAQRGDGGTLLVADYTREVVGDTAYIRISTQSHDVQLEYYADLETEASTRQFVWSWQSAPEQVAFSYEIQLPGDATDIRVDPAPQREEKDEEGHRFLLGAFGKAAGKGACTVRLTYARAQGLQMVGQAAVRVAPTDAKAVGNPAWVWWVLGVALLVFGASVVVFVRGRRGGAGA